MFRASLTKKNPLVKFVKNNPKLYVLFRSIKSINDPNLYKLLRELYEYDYVNSTIMQVDCWGDSFQDDIVYYIYPGMDRSRAGLCALIRDALEYLNISDRFQFTPVIHWDKNILYYDIDMEEATRNVFEYYFEPVSNISYDEVHKCKCVIQSHEKQKVFARRNILTESIDYRINDDTFKKLGLIFTKYIKPNKNTKSYLDRSLDILTDKRTLGVHARGTDFLVGYWNHPIPVTAEEYVKKTKSMFQRGDYDQIFLATDDTNILSCFLDEFKQKVVYFHDAKRSGDTKASYAVEVDRPFHFYKLGLEVLRDAYTLGYCSSLIGSLSNVALTARLINYSRGNNYDEIEIFDKGIQDTDTKEAVKLRKWLRKKRDNEMRQIK